MAEYKVAVEYQTRYVVNLVVEADSEDTAAELAAEIVEDETDEVEEMEATGESEVTYREVIAVLSIEEIEDE